MHNPMHNQDDTRAVNTQEKTRELEDILHYNQNILDRLAGFEERLSLVRGRLSGVNPKVAPEGSGQNADTGGGIMGALQIIHQESSTRCDAIAEWLDDIERVV